VIEWADRFPELIPEQARWISFEIKSEQQRIITLFHYGHENLALELSTSRGSLAWLDGEIEFTREWLTTEKFHSVFREAPGGTKKIWRSGNDHVGLGPGSYAGTRIAISAAIGYNFLVMRA